MLSLQNLLLFLPVIMIAIGWSYLQKKKENSVTFRVAKTHVLDQFAKDLTAMIRDKKIDPVIGREKEIIRVIQILSRRTKSNPVLVGKAGVGKTAIVEGLAQAIVAGRVPESLLHKRVLSLDLTSTVAGTKFRGEFEKRLMAIRDEIVAAERSIILFIDEIHILAQAGEAEGSIDAADIFKPELARGDLQVVGATTDDEYKQYILKDPTLARRLQPVFISEPSARETLQILRGIQEKYEGHHNVTIREEALKKVVALTAKMKGRAFPDKAIDLLDEACSKTKLENIIQRGHVKNDRPQVTASVVSEVYREWQD